MTKLDEVIAFEAAFLRAALLVGLVHEQEVPEWADARLSAHPRYATELAEILSARIELTAMREALRELARGVDNATIASSLLNAVAIDGVTTDRAVADRVRILAHIRREGGLNELVAGQVKLFEDRLMLASVDQPGVVAPSHDEVSEWLDSVRGQPVFQFAFQYRDEAAAFIAAVSRRLHRDRRALVNAEAYTGCGWLLDRSDHDSDDTTTVVMLNERAWVTVMREFSPVPLASRIPYALPADGMSVVLDENTAQSIGVEQAFAAFNH